MFRKLMKKKSQKSLRFFRGGAEGQGPQTFFQKTFSGRCPPKSSNVIAIPAPKFLYPYHFFRFLIIYGNNNTT